MPKTLYWDSTRTRPDQDVIWHLTDVLDCVHPDALSFYPVDYRSWREVFQHIRSVLALCPRVEVQIGNHYWASWPWE
jgi:hypothetical protein